MRYFLLLPCLVLGQRAHGIYLTEAIKIAQRNAYELREQEFALEEIKAQKQALSKAHDTTIYATVSGLHDYGGLKNNSAQIPNESKTETYTLGAKKYFGWGVSLDAKLVKEETKQSFTMSPTDMINRKRLLRPEVTFSIDLWRNRLAREITLNKLKLTGFTHTPKMTYLTTTQAVGYETEKMYWQLGLLNDQIAIAKKLLNTTNKFASSMKRRMQLGRADDVDVADADANSIAREAALLQLQVARDQVATNLSYRVYGSPKTANFRKISLSMRNSMPIPAQNEKLALEKAYQNRFDLQLIAKQMETIKINLHLADEQAKPRANFFGTLTRPGLANSAADAVQAMRPSILIGIHLETELANTGPDAARRETQASIQKLMASEQQIRRSLAADIAATFSGWRGAKRQISQKDSQIDHLVRKKQAEQTKVRQARSDTVVVLRYQIQVLAAKFERLQILKSQYDNVASIRHQLHAYPRGS